MKLDGENFPQSAVPLHLTYCLNVHPGLTWDENFSAIRQYTLKVRDLVNYPGPFGLGLRLGCQAARTLSEPAELDSFKQFLDANNLYVFTINGFPYGEFYGPSVKENVYRPDWLDSARLNYTIMLVDILAQLLPEGVSGSISTVAGSYKKWITDSDQVRLIAENIASAAAHAAKALSRCGKEIVIALEGEPDCLIGSTDEAIKFFTGPLAEVGKGDPEQIISRHVGVCFDTAHQCVEFEDLGASLNKLDSAGIKIAKIHLSSALSVGPAADSPAVLEDFYRGCEKTYLHQTRIRRPDGTILSYPDLAQALADPNLRHSPADQWRVHFHVPLFFTGSGQLQPTTSQFTPQFISLLKQGICEHLEIETYTYHVLPESIAIKNVPDGIAREYRWVMGRLEIGN